MSRSSASSRAQHVVDVDQVLADEPPAVACRSRSAPDSGRCGRVDSSHGAVALRRVPSSGVGRTPSRVVLRVGAGARARTRLRVVRLRRRTAPRAPPRPARARPARPRRRRSRCVSRSSAIRMNVPIPSSSASRASSSTHCAGRRARQTTFSSRRIARGSRPASTRGLVDRGVARGQVARLRGTAGSGSQPSALRPVRRSMRGLYAPIQIPTSCSGAGPRAAPRAGSRRPRACARAGLSRRPRARGSRRSPPRARRRSRPGVSRAPPIASIPSQNAPAPMPELDPPAAEDVEARDRRGRRPPAARSGRLSTFGARRTRVVRAATNESSVQVSRNRAW